jgi:flagellin
MEVTIMRIQHNIMAMNAYRNYSSNNSALSKNLEKLSSGYKINRAGDDAAGLAISEKMRAQISGLQQATSNAKSGINLVGTAEGSLTEVHDMLNRMVTLADQSANGTYDNETDRNNLQKEVSQLKSEINRIADSSNFNGIKLLDGSLSASGASNSVPEISGLDLTDVAATKAAPTIAFTALTSPLSADKTFSATINYTDADGNAQSSTLNLTYNDTDQTLTTAGGVSTAVSTTAHQPSATELATAFSKAAAEDSGLSSTFKFSSSNVLTLTAKTAGANTAVESTVQNWKADGSADTTLATVTANAGAEAYQKIDFAKTENEYTVGDTFTIGGQKFAFVDSQTDAEKLGEDGVNSIVVAAPATGVANGDAIKMRDLIAQKTGYTPTVGASPSTIMEFKVPDGTSGTGGLTLQIGDTAESFNQLTVSVGDMHSKALGIGDIDISTQAGAKTAVDKIKSAINSVSSTRGNLGALQNRLDHTINNLGVMTENIQDAESTVRDTDVASEMMAYTKNNILVQSAQAMLAQANQVPQGVLQLLQ